ncbi:MAG: family 16 glycosylhydrolase [Candidatus Margulisiibacteriota bacterium]
MAQEMNAPESAWDIRNGANGPETFGSIFQPSMVDFQDGVLQLSLDRCRSNCKGFPYASGEYRTRGTDYSYGYYEWRMKPASAQGIMGGSGFVFSGTWGEASHREIDFEFIGNQSNMVETNYYFAGSGKNSENKEDIPLNFDPTKDFHNYGFRWAPNDLTFYVDGQPVRHVTTNIPNGETQIMANIWKGSTKPDIIGWLGEVYSGGRQIAFYDWIRYSTLEAATQQPPTAAAPTLPTPTTTAALPVPAPAVSRVIGLPIGSIQQRSYVYNPSNSSIKEENGVYTFQANRAADPGFGIATGNADLGGRKTLRFEVRGSITKHGNWARLIAQVYNDKNNAGQPTITFDSIDVTNDWTEVIIYLGSVVSNLQKLQWQLSSDLGSCQIEVRNIRFE